VRFDHHPSAAPIAAEIDITDETAFATGQLVYDFFELQSFTLTREEALGLFVAFATDTGWFRYSNTTPGTLRRAAGVLESGIDPAEIYRSIYQTNDLGLIRLTGRVISMVHSEMDDRLLWAVIDQDMIRDEGLDADFESDILMDILRSSRSTHCVALFREVSDGTVRVNLRSKGTVNVSKIAEAFGGGGHRNAAGATINGSNLEQSADRVVDALKKELTEADSRK
jgi:phosphoesterase RecJ-like protein